MRYGLMSCLDAMLAYDRGVEVGGLCSNRPMVKVNQTVALEFSVKQGASQ